MAASISTRSLRGCEDDVAKLQMAAKALEKKGIQVYVIFAKLSDFTSEELVRCQAISGKYERRLILFTAREKEEFDTRGSAISLEDMANTTHTVCYAQRRQAPPAAHIDPGTVLAEDSGALQ